VDSTGQTIDFLLTAKRDTAAAKRFFRKALSSPGNPVPRVINVDKNPVFPAAIEALKTEGVLPRRVRLRQCGVEVWRGGLGGVYPLPALSAAGASLTPSCSVSTPRSSNRTGAANASGSRRKVHEFAHGKLRGRVVRRTSPSTLWRWTSGNRPVPNPRTLCLAHSH
jgi:hypothetical protein